MKAKYLFKSTIVLLLLALFSCKKSESVSQKEDGLISLSLASPDYILDEEKGTIRFTLKLSLTRQDNPQTYSVVLQPALIALKQQLDEMGDAIAMPSDLYNVPMTVEVPDGQLETDFHLTINRNLLMEKYPRLYDKQLVVAVRLAKPSRYGIDEANATVAVSINTIDIMPEPVEPEPEPEQGDNLLQNGDFNGSSANWTVTNQNGDLELDIIFSDKLTFSGGETGGGFYNYTVYQALTVEQGKRYKLSGDIATSGTRANPAWAEFFLHPNEPELGGDYSDGRLISFDYPCLDGISAAGKIEVLACSRPGNVAADGVFTSAVDGTVFFVIKVGSGWGGSIGTVELDNLTITEVE